MPKRVNSQEGDLGKPLAGEKRDLGKRLAVKKGEKGKQIALEKRMRGTGEMLAGRMVTRSVATALSNEGSQDPLSSSESDQSLHEKFLEWAKKHDKKYESEEKQEERFLIWRSTKDRLDKRHAHKPGYDSEMSVFADWTVSEKAKLHGTRFTEDPFDGRWPVVNLRKTKKEREEEQKARIEFDKWVEDHGKKYGSKKERDKRFLAFFENKKRIDSFMRANSWKHGYNLGNMDKMFWEH